MACGGAAFGAGGGEALSVAGASGGESGALYSKASRARSSGVGLSMQNSVELVRRMQFMFRFFRRWTEVIQDVALSSSSCGLVFVKTSKRTLSCVLYSGIMSVQLPSNESVGRYGRLEKSASLFYSGEGSGFLGSNLRCSQSDGWVSTSRAGVREKFVDVWRVDEEATGLALFVIASFELVGCFHFSTELCKGRHNRECRRCGDLRVH